MNFLVVVSLVAAVAHATPFASRGFMGLTPFTTPGMMGMDTTTSTLQKAHDFVEQVQQARMEQALFGMKESVKDIGFKGAFGVGTGLVKTMASEMTGEAQQAEMTQMLESLDQVKKSPVMFMNTMPVSPLIVEQAAVKEMQKSAMVQENNFMLTTKEMEDTFEAAFLAETAVMQSPEIMKNPAAMKILQEMAMDFRLQVQLLIQENNVEKTKATMRQQQHQMKQLKSQIKFLKFELLKLKTLGMTTMTPFMGSMAKAEGVLVAQLNKLIAKEVALEMVIEQLQRVVVSQQKQMMLIEGKEVATIASPVTMTMMMPVTRMMGY
ncbi:hypothetical protein GWI33_003013 [Rhynchophorus ferrugineus]|uniref:Uncharacterized protein n=1 Tax=Rhynchophorus ferrugineus TaxID=354439 RepID=A0A834INY5_RHYFE|nr:hypothetical protein GWI33_003013 [Rhynchophorus ferrugineus]